MSANGRRSANWQLGGAMILAAIGLLALAAVRAGAPGPWVAAAALALLAGIALIGLSLAIRKIGPWLSDLS